MSKYTEIEHLMPKARKASKVSNYRFLCALLYIIGNACKWRALPEKYGKWHTIYMRFNCWAKNGTIKRIFEQLQSKNIIDHQSIGCSRGELTTKIHLCGNSSKFAVAFHISAGNKNDASEGRKLIRTIHSTDRHILIADRTQEDMRTRKVMKEQGFIPVEPPKKNRKASWKYDKEMYKSRNEIERYFCRLKRFRKVFTRYDKLDIIFLSVISLAMIFDALFI